MSSHEAAMKIESLLGTQLPEDFRSWLTDDSRVCPVPSDVTIPDDPPWIDEVVYLYNAEQLLSFTTEEHDMNLQGVRNLPNETLLLGGNDLGDYYLLSLRRPDFGSVYYLFHETAAPEEDDWAGIFVLAPSFRDWLATLVQKQTNPNIPDWEHIRREELDEILNTPSKPPRPWWRFW